MIESSLPSLQGIPRLKQYWTILLLGSRDLHPKTRRDIHLQRYQSYDFSSATEANVGSMGKSHESITITNWKITELFYPHYVALWPWLDLDLPWSDLEGRMGRPGGLPWPCPHVGRCRLCRCWICPPERGHLYSAHGPLQGQGQNETLPRAVVTSPVHKHGLVDMTSNLQSEKGRLIDEFGHEEWF